MHSGEQYSKDDKLDVPGIAAALLKTRRLGANLTTGPITHLGQYELTLKLHSTSWRLYQVPGPVTASQAKLTVYSEPCSRG